MKLGLLVALLSVACGRSGFDAIVPRDGNSQQGMNDAALDSDASDANPVDPDGAMASGDGPADGSTGLLNQASFLQPVPSGTAPAARRSSGAVVQPGANETLWAFGGYDGTFRSDTVAYSITNNQWTSPAIASPPAGRERHALSFDTTQNILVMFGGQKQMAVMLQQLDELWFYTPGGSWTQVPKAGSWPAARHDAALVYMPHAQKFLLFGGTDGSGTTNRYNDVWTLTINTAGPSATWTQLTPGGVTGPKQSAGCYAYDAAAHRLIVYGGETQDGTDVNTTFEYLVDSNAWQQDTTTGNTPPQSFQECVWDPGTSRVMVYGGQNAGGAPTNGSFAYDPATKAWTTLSETAPPGNRSDAGAVYSPTLGKMIWFGGRTAQTTYTASLVTMDLN